MVSTNTRCNRRPVWDWDRKCCWQTGYFALPSPTTRAPFSVATSETTTVLDCRPREVCTHPIECCGQLWLRGQIATVEDALLRVARALTIRLAHRSVMGLVEPIMMRGLQPVGPSRTTLEVIIPSQSGLSGQVERNSHVMHTGLALQL